MKRLSVTLVAPVALAAAFLIGGGPAHANGFDVYFSTAGGAGAGHHTGHRHYPRYRHHGHYRHRGHYRYFQSQRLYRPYYRSHPRRGRYVPWRAFPRHGFHAQRHWRPAFRHYGRGYRY